MAAASVSLSLRRAIMRHWSTHSFIMLARRLKLRVLQLLRVERVPGAAELPFAAATLAKHSSFDAIICIGVVIAGDTNHHEIIGDSTAAALLDLSIAKKVPVINGILVVNNLSQAQARAGDEINRGKEFAQAALEMAQFTKKWKTN